MEICSFLLSEINLGDFGEEDCTALMPDSPLLAPTTVPHELAARMEPLLLEAEEQPAKRTRRFKSRKISRKTARRLRKGSRLTQDDSNQLAADLL